uniref:Uncharacterized protein n=1 Tax=Bionectria ochroleuca TaxID=29856 RepID=A0A0B7K216_BIOOC
MAGPEENQDKQRRCLARSAYPEFLHLHRFPLHSSACHQQRGRGGNPPDYWCRPGTKYLPILIQFSPRPQASTVGQRARYLAMYMTSSGSEGSSRKASSPTGR